MEIITHNAEYFMVLLLAGAILVAKKLEWKMRLFEWILTILHKHIKSVGNKETQRHKEITAILIKLQVELCADRAYVCEFHNGETFQTNQPIWKVSCTYEYCKSGISYLGMLLQNLKVTILLDILCSLFGENVHGVTLLDCKKCKPDATTNCPNKGVRLYNIDQLPEGSGKAFFHLQGIKHILMTPISCGNKIVGYLGIDYCSTEYSTPENYNLLCTEATTISYLLTR